MLLNSSINGVSTKSGTLELKKCHSRPSTSHKLRPLSVVNTSRLTQNNHPNHSNNSVTCGRGVTAVRTIPSHVLPKIALQLRALFLQSDFDFQEQLEGNQGDDDVTELRQVVLQVTSDMARKVSQLATYGDHKNFAVSLETLFRTIPLSGNGNVVESEKEKKVKEIQEFVSFLDVKSTRLNSAVVSVDRKDRLYRAFLKVALYARNTVRQSVTSRGAEKQIFILDDDLELGRSQQQHFDILGAGVRVHEVVRRASSSSSNSLANVLRSSKKGLLQNDYLPSLAVNGQPYRQTHNKLPGFCERDNVSSTRRSVEDDNSVPFVKPNIRINTDFTFDELDFVECCENSPRFPMVPQIPNISLSPPIIKVRR